MIIQKRMLMLIYTEKADAQNFLFYTKLNQQSFPIEALKVEVKKAQEK